MSCHDCHQQDKHHQLKGWVSSLSVGFGYPWQFSVKFLITANEMNNINRKASSDKRSLESSVHTIHAELEEMLQQAKIWI